MMKEFLSHTQKEFIRILKIADMLLLITVKITVKHMKRIKKNLWKNLRTILKINFNSILVLIYMYE